MLPLPPPHVRAHHARVFYAPSHTHVDGHDLGTRERRHAAGARRPPRTCCARRLASHLARFATRLRQRPRCRRRIPRAHGETRPPRRSPELRRYTRRRLQSRPIPPRGARWSPTRRTRRHGRTRLRARSGKARLRARRPAPTRTRARLPRGCRRARFRLLQPCRLLSANDAAADANARATSGFAG